MNYGAKILRRVLKNVELMTIEDYNALYESVKDEKQVNIVTVEFKSDIYYLEPQQCHLIVRYGQDNSIAHDFSFHNNSYPYRNKGDPFCGFIYSAMTR